MPPALGASRRRVVMLLENNGYPGDVRVRAEAESLVGAGHDVTVVAPRQAGEARREKVRGVRVARFHLPETPPTPAGFVLEYLLANVQLHVRGALALLRGADVVHVHNPPDTLFGLGLLARLLGKRMVFDHHDLAPELFGLKFGDRRVVRALELLERASMRVATRVVAANESQCQVAQTRGGVLASRVSVVRNGPPAAWLARATPGRDGVLDPVRLVFVGSMERQDGAEALPEVVRDLQERHGVRAELTLVGEGSSRAQIAQRAEALGVAERVRFTGRVAGETVPDLVAEHDVCLDPAECGELNHSSTMIKVAEYMACRRPVVAYRLRETERTAGDTVAFADCGDRDGFVAQVARLARDPQERSRLADLAHQRASDLTWEHSAQVLRAMYRSL